MSSSDNSQNDWSVFMRRDEALPNVELISPAAEVAGLLDLRHTLQQQEQQRAQDKQELLLEVLSQQAVLVAQFEIVLKRQEETLAQLKELPAAFSKAHRSLRIVKDQMLQALRSNGLVIDIPMGKTFNDIGEAVRVEGWRHHKDYVSETVIEVMEPIVYYQENLVHMGRVIMGGPLEAEDDSIR